MKYTIKKLNKDDPIFKQGFVFSSSKKTYRNISNIEKKQKIKKLFLEPIADQKFNYRGYLSKAFKYPYQKWLEN